MTKIARIKIKSCNSFDIFDVVIAHSIMSMSDKLYLYVDDRDELHDPLQIKNILTIMGKFGIYPDNIIKYSEYYDIAWIYVHRLVKCKNVKIGTDYNNHNVPEDNDDDLKVISNSQRRVKITLKVDGLTENLTEAESVIFNNGWFREAFLLSLIDDSEMIEYVPDTTELELNMFTGVVTIPTNDKIKNILSELLDFNCPTKVLSNLASSINTCVNESIPDGSLGLRDLDLDQILNLGLSIDQLTEIIRKHKGLLDNMVIRSAESIDKTDGDRTMYVIKNPISVEVENTKIVTIAKNNMEIKHRIWVEDSEILNTISTDEGKSKVRLRFGGGL